MAPIKSCANDHAFLKTFRFLLYRFRPDCWWWQIVFLLRQTALAFATVVSSSNPHAQLFYTSFILAIYVVFVSRFWPWINSEISIVDCGTCLLLLMTLLCAAQFLPEASDSQGRLPILMTLFALLAVVTVQYLVTIIISICRNGLFGEFNDSKSNRVKLCEDWLIFLSEAQKQDSAEVIKTICRMNSFDLLKLRASLHCWTAHSKHVMEVNPKHTTRLHKIPSRAKPDAGVSVMMTEWASATGSRSSMGNGSSQARSSTRLRSSASEQLPFEGSTLLQTMRFQAEMCSEKPVFEKGLARPPVFKIHASQGTPDIFKTPHQSEDALHSMSLSEGLESAWRPEQS